MPDSLLTALLLAESEQFCEFGIMVVPAEAVQVDCLIEERMGDVLRSGSLPGRLMVLSADDKSILTAPELLLNSMGLEDLFFIILMGVIGCWPFVPPKNI